MRARAADSGVRLAELMAALSIATDLGMGQPLETALCSCVVAMRLGEALNLDDDTLRDVYYQALLRYIGCNAETYAMAALFGDELALRRDFAAVDPGQPPEVVGLVVRYIRQANAGEPPSRVAELVARGLLTLPQLRHESFAGHCEVAQRLAGRLGLAESLIVCLGQLYERWDGKGLPRGLKGEEVAPAVLLVTLAQDAVVWTRIGGPDAAVATVRKRSGGAYHPRMAERFCEEAPTILAGLDQEPTWESVLALEPGGRDCLTDEEFDRSLRGAGRLRRHQIPLHPGPFARRGGAGGRRRPALRAGRGGRDGAAPGRPPARHRARRRLRGDLGQSGRALGAGVGAGPAARLLYRPGSGPSGAARGAWAPWRRSITSGWTAPATIAAIPGQALSPAARILAAADAYHAMTEPRPHRPALSAEEAAEELRREVRAGRLDGDAVHAVLAEAGHRVPRTRRERPAGLSQREVEVLRLLARGLSNRDMAEQLSLSPDTVKHHIQHIYDKTGVSTRAGATLFAMEHSLL